jgi:hypothetical protein
MATAFTCCGHVIGYAIFFYGCIKDAVYILPLPSILPKNVWRIPAAAMHINIWTELEYRYGNCLASYSVHIEN